jgi:hypothetical protein
MKTTKIAIAATMVLSFLPISSAVAADAVEEGLKVQFNEMTCGEMLIQTGSSRDFTMIFMHGVINGMKKDYLFDAVKVSEATDVVYSMCVADTDANLLKVFEEARK